jgi:hypothetical protein
LTILWAPRSRPLFGFRTCYVHRCEARRFVSTLKAISNPSSKTPSFVFCSSLDLSYFYIVSPSCAPPHTPVYSYTVRARRDGEIQPNEDIKNVYVFFTSLLHKRRETLLQHANRARANDVLPHEYTVSSRSSHSDALAGVFMAALFRSMPLPKVPSYKWFLAAGEAEVGVGVRKSGITTMGIRSAQAYIAYKSCVVQSPIRAMHMYLFPEKAKCVSPRLSLMFVECVPRLSSACSHRPLSQAPRQHPLPLLHRGLAASAVPPPRAGNRGEVRAWAWSSSQRRW